MATKFSRATLQSALLLAIVGAAFFVGEPQTFGNGEGSPAPSSSTSSSAGAPASVYGRPPPPANVKPVTRNAEASVSACSDDFVKERECVADALDAYADALRKLSPSLPPDLQVLPDIVSRAASRVRTAKNKAEAVKAIKIAVAEVHKTISLLKADDSFTLATETREGAFVAETLEVASNKLEKAVGL